MHVGVGVIFLNVAVMASEYYGMRDDILFWIVHVSLTATCQLAYVIEFVIKIVGLGLVGYFASGHRIFEFALLASIFVDDFASSGAIVIPPMVLRVVRLGRVARVLRLLRGQRARDLREMIRKLMVSAPAILNVLSVLALIVFIYAILGMQLFTFVAPGESLNEFANFRSFGGACILLFQCLTGDGWYAIMLDTANDRSQGCDPSAVPTGCGNPWLGIPYFLSFTVIGSFVFLNLVVAVVLEKFLSLWQAREEMERRQREQKPSLITSDDVADFTELWSEYDPDGTGQIKREVCRSRGRAR